MEAYGWRMDQGEQDRVNRIFNNTVDRMRAQGFVVEARAPTSVSHDITMFTADRPDKHLIFMWSAGEIGLVMVLCETSAPLEGHAGAGQQVAASQPWTESSPSTGASRRERPAQPVDPDFSPAGDWVGSYTCTQGTMGATLHIGRLRGSRFEGQFRFYPTPKNPYVPAGRYRISGEYDRDTMRILINPGAWLERPGGYNSTIVIGSFNPVDRTFSGYFQGVSGCTSLEARYSADGDAAARTPAGPVKKKAAARPKKALKKAAMAQKAAKAKKVSEASKPIETALPAAPEAVEPPSAGMPPGIEVGGPAAPPSGETVPAAPAPEASVPPSAPSSPEPPAALVPVAAAPPAVAAPAAPAPAPEPAPVSPLPSGPSSGSAAFPDVPPAAPAPPPQP
jgi:hypothetical protein